MDTLPDHPPRPSPKAFAFDNSFARDLKGFYTRTDPTPVSAPRLLRLNHSLAAELGVDAEALERPDGVAILAGNSIAEGAEPIALAYAGHQFGGFSPQLGDGRALLIGEVIAGVDLAKLGPNDVLVSTDGRVTVIVPAAEVFVTRLDNEKSYVYERATGLFTKGDINLESQARQVAEDEIRNGALEDGILNIAQTTANAVIERLLRSLGFKDVVLVVATPTTP